MGVEELGENQMSQSAGNAATEPVLEMNRLVELRTIQIPGEQDLVAKLFDLFLRTSTKHLAGLAQLGRERDLKNLQEEAHAFKSGARTLGAVRLGNACRSLEEICVAATESEVPAAIEMILHEYQLLVAEMERVRKLPVDV